MNRAYHASRAFKNAYRMTCTRTKNLSHVPASPLSKAKLDQIIASMELTPEEQEEQAKSERFDQDYRAWLKGQGERPEYPYDADFSNGEVFDSNKELEVG